MMTLVLMLIIIIFDKPVDYYETGKLNTTTSDLASNATQMFMHINIRSLSIKTDSVITELSLLVDKPTIIAITETWAKSDSDSLPIPG